MKAVIIPGDTRFGGRGGGVSAAGCAGGGGRAASGGAAGGAADLGAEGPKSWMRRDADADAVGVGKHTTSYANDAEAVGVGGMLHRLLAEWNRARAARC
jgi:hypothetical protein